MHATNSVAGPFAAEMMAEYGADVIWLENNIFPDYQRAGTGTTAEQDRRNQRTISVDIPSPGGKEIFLRLLKNIDIFIECSKFGQYDKWGLTDEVMWQQNPRLIIAHITGFGQYGDPGHIRRPSYDPIAQAFGCYMGFNGFPDRIPIPAAPVVADYLTGMYTAFAAMAALHRVQQTGIGESIDSAQYEIVMRCQAGYAIKYFETGELPNRAGDRSFSFCGYGNYTCKDGVQVFLLTVGPGIYPKSVEFFGLNGLYEGKKMPQYCAFDAPEAEEYEAAVEKYVSEHTAEEAEREMLKAGIPCSRLLTYETAKDNPHYIAREVFTSWKSFSGRELTGINVFPKLKNNPGQIWRPCPSIGMDNEDILKDIGYSVEEIAEFYEANAIGKGPLNI